MIVTLFKNLDIHRYAQGAPSLSAKLSLVRIDTADVKLRYNLRESNSVLKVTRIIELEDSLILRRILGIATTRLKRRFEDGEKNSNNTGLG